MANINEAFQPESGINLDDLVGIFAGVTDPSTVGEAAPIGSLFIRSNGSLYQKVGPLDTNWLSFAQGVGEAVKVSATDTTSGYLNAKLLVDGTLTKTTQNAGANENIVLGLTTVGTAGTYKSVTTNNYGQVTAGTNPTTLVGYGITDAQPLNARLTAVAALATTGMLTQITATTYANRTLTGSANQITITNGTGVAGNPTFSFPATALTFPGTQGVIIPTGTTAQRIATIATIRFNSTTTQLEYYNGVAWISLVASTGGTVTSIATAQPASGLTVSGGPITTSGTLTFALANDLAGVEGLLTLGFSARTATDTWTTRTLTGTTNRLSVSNGDGILADPVFDIASTYVGQTSITTLGLIGTGTWQGDIVGTQFGGTGRSSIGAANQLLGVNTTATGLEYKTLANGTGIGLAFTGGQITISNTGVLSVTGTANQVIATAATGSITLSLPQSIGTASTPTFASVTVAANPTLPLQLATKQYVDAAVQGIAPKQSARLGTTANITLSGLQTIDGVLTVDGDRILVKNQTAPATNGVYLASASAWTRAADFDAWAEVPSAFVFIEDGTQADTAWISTANQGGTLGTTAIPWVQFSSAADIQVGTGLTRSINTISITPVGTAGSYNNVTTNASGQVVSGSNVAYLTTNQNITLQGDVAGTGTTLINTTLSNTGVGAGTYQSVTVDAKGRVTAGSNPNTLAGYFITDAQPLSAYLTSVAALATNGIVVRNGTTALVRSIIAGSTKITVANGDGIAGNPTIDVVEANLALDNLSGTLTATKGGTGLTSLGAANQIFGVNSLGTAAEYKTLTGSGITVTHSAGGILLTANTSGTVTSVAATGSTGLTVGGSPITGSGTLTFTLGTELQGLSGLSTLGFVARTTAGTYTTRSVVSGNGTITITNPLGTANNVGIDLATVGSAGTYRSVTTDVYGRVTAGTNPTTIAGYGITDAVNTSLVGAVNGLATLDNAGKLTLTQLPAIAITDTFVVASQAAMLALTAEVGDVAVRTDANQSFILRATPATVFSNWQLLLTPTDSVLSVNGLTGIVNVGTVTSIGITAPASGVTVSGSPVTTAGNITLALADDLAAVEGLATAGFAVRTGTSTWTTRAFVAGSGISLSNTDGVIGNITISATGAGSVTSVGLALPSIFTVTGSPVTGTGVLTGTLASQAAGTFFVAPLAGGVPTFRTVGLDELSDVVLTAPASGNILSFNGTNWVNTAASAGSAAGLIGVGQAGVAAWTLVSGTRYSADFAHNLATNNLVITVFDSATNAIVIPDSVVLSNTNTIRVQVVGNTKTLRVVAVANGLSVGSGGGSGSLAVAKDATVIGATTTTLNFTGPVVVSDAGSGQTNLNLISRFSYFANSLDTPNNADFAVNALAPVTTDPTYTALNVRSFSNTVEQGVGFTLSIPPGCTQITFKIRGRATTAPGAVSVVQPRLYSRLLPNNAAVGAWSAASELANVSIPTNAFFQYSTQTIALTTLSLTADRLYQFELTRRVAGVTGTNLGSAFLLAELTVEFY